MTTATNKKIIIKEFILELIQEGKLDDVSIFLDDICKLLTEKQVEKFLKKYS
tara:strand:+ start:48 stop:203 length:156 start_codon:yes stop_codon:yes gene_type:complete